MEGFDFKKQPIKYSDLREFISALEKQGLLKRISYEINPYLEMTEISDRTLKGGGPALLFENPLNHSVPVLTNLFGTGQRIAMAMGEDDIASLKEIGRFLAFLKEPEPPKGLKEAWANLPIFKQILNLSPKKVSKAPCHDKIIPKNEINLPHMLPVQTCWPEDAAPLITWGLVVTKGPDGSRQNMGIYRQQLLDDNKVIMRWLPNRGGAMDFQKWQQQYPGKAFPISVVLGCDPATMLAAVTPIPDALSEYAFAGLLRGYKTKLVQCLTNDLEVPATAEIVLEGFIYPGEITDEGPFGDHTGYYNEVEKFPVMTIETITHRKNPIYHSTYTGRPPDEPAMLGVAFNEIFIPLLQKQFPEIIDFYLPPEGCSYRVAVVSMKKQYPGHAKRVMFGVWSFLKQFMFTKFVIVVDNDINTRNWEDVIWAITTRMDPSRDTTLVENTPIDYLDFASPSSGIGSKMGMDATTKIQSETTRDWGKPIKMDQNTKQKIDDLWDKLGIFE